MFPMLKADELAGEFESLGFDHTAAAAAIAKFQKDGHPQHLANEHAHQILVDLILTEGGGPLGWQVDVAAADGDALKTVDARTLPPSRLDALQVEAAEYGDVLGAAVYAAAAQAAREAKS